MPSNSYLSVNARLAPSAPAVALRGVGSPKASRPRLGPGGRGGSNVRLYRSSAGNMVLHERSSSGSTDSVTGFSTRPPHIDGSSETTPSTSTWCPSQGGFTGALTSVCNVRKYISPWYSVSQHGTVLVSRTMGQLTKLRRLPGAGAPANAADASARNNAKGATCLTAHSGS